MTIRVLNPHCAPAARSELVALAARLPELRGRTIGFLDNRRADRYFRRMQQRMLGEHAPLDTRYYTKPWTTRPSDDRKLQEIAAECDAVVVGVAM